MKFIVLESKKKAPRALKYPFVVLTRNSWDDFGLRTLFDVELNISATRSPIRLGSVKILNLIQTRGETELPSEFTRLQNDFCSLGQDISYYESLYILPKKIAQSYLAALHDVVHNDADYQRFKKHPGFEGSLIRSSAARAALNTGRRKRFKFVRDAQEEFTRGFTFSAKVSGAEAPFIVQFSFDRDNRLPSRTNVLIGRNGTGKTHYLAHLAIALTGLGTRREVIDKTAGHFIGTPPVFRKVIAVSYNAFDGFPLPGEYSGGKSAVRKTGELFGYVYCGLRNTLQKRKTLTLKTQNDMLRSLDHALQLLKQRNHFSRWKKIVEPVLRSAGIQELNIDAKSLNKSFRALSSGQKLVLLVLAECYTHLEPNSIVLFDEPENHLHPTLLAEFLFAFRRILEARDSFAILATHSPVVLQETPSKYVKVFERVDTTPIIRNPEIETFGETIGHITTEIFHVTSDVTDYHSVFDSLMKKGLSIHEIEVLLGKPLSLSVRSYVLRRRTNNEKNGDQHAKRSRSK